MFRIANHSDIPGFLPIWREAFGDSDASIEAFFAHFPGCISYAAEEDGKIVSMVHALPQLLSPDTLAAYIYAVATDSAYRGRGLCAGLMAFAEEDLRRRGVQCTVLRPGEPSLFGFYEKMGYAADFTRNRSAFPGGTPISREDYAALRESLISVPHLIYDDRLLSYAETMYGLTFYRTETGIAAAAETYVGEVLPEDLGGEAYAMVKWLGEPQQISQGYLGFSLE